MTSPATTGARPARRRPSGPILMALGALLLAAGILQTTAATVDVSASCPAGTSLVAKFNRVGPNYVFEKPAGNQSVVTITNGSATGGTWSSTTPISAVVVKGGPNSVVATLSPPQSSGTFSNAALPIVGAGNRPDVSNVQFCGPSQPAPTTTTASTTTTSQPPSTTAAPTTTTAPTSTTAAPTTTTAPTSTTAAPTTTTSPTSTTAAPTTTTAAPSTTTTTEPDEGATGTTEPGPTTTAAAPPTTTEPDGTSDPASAGFGDAATSVSVEPDRSEPGRSLPFTGTSSLPLIGFGVLLFASGGALTLVARRRDHGLQA